jgi:hypothetical protein
MQKTLIPTNTDIDGASVCIKSNYYKTGCTNFQPQIGGGKYAATGVIEIVYEDNGQIQLPNSI